MASTTFVDYSTPAVAAAWLNDVNRQVYSVVLVKNYGVVGDGVTDDTAAISAAHTYANSNNLNVSYAGLSQVALQANADIAIKTSTDFCNCKLVILGGVEGTPSSTIPNTLFTISDDACPLETTSGAVSSTNLERGSYFPTLDLFNGHGFAKLTCDLPVPNRDKDGTIDYVQVFKINRLGRASHPLSTDLTAYAADITVDYRKTSINRLSINNLYLVEGTWNNQIILQIERCNVEVNNFTMLFTSPGTTFNNICKLISIADSSDITINNFITTGRPVTASTGSYCLSINGGADIIVNNMNALTGWGATGNNNINGLKVINSVVNRVDCHSSAHNIFVENSEIHENGAVYGWGGGIFKVSNSRVYRCPVIQARSDYGGTFFGSLVVQNVEVNHNFTATYTAVDLTTNPLGASTNVYAPDSIEVDNLIRVGKASANNAELIPVSIKISGTSVVYAPARISVTNAGCSFATWRFGLRLDTLNMEGNSTTPTCRILLSNIYPDSAANGSASVLSTGVLDYDSVRTPTTPVRPYVRVSSADNIALQFRNSENVDIRCINTGLNAVVVDTATSTKPLVVLESCRLTTIAGGFTTAPIGASNSGTSGHTILRNCEVAGLFDLSLVAALIGTTIRTGANQPTLPATVTATQAFEGWQKSGVFS